jgi:triacylglycerol lipase
MGDIRCMPQGFKPNVAAELGNLVVAAYDQFQPRAGRPPKWPLSAPYQLLAEFSASPPTKGPEKFGFVARRTDTGDVYVAFRGTQTIGDWLANADFLQVGQKNGWGKAEKGFSGVYNGTAPSITDVLRNAGSPTHVYVTGHSLGGSLATLCAADVRATLKATTTLYAFASPRTGDLDFADQFNTQCPDTWRIVNSEDIVNTVPLATTAVEEFQLSGLDTVAQHLANISFLPATAKQSLARVRSIFDGGKFEHVGTSVDFTQHNGTVVANHDMATYLAALGVKIDTPLAQTAAASRA